MGGGVQSPGGGQVVVDPGTTGDTGPVGGPTNPNPAAGPDVVVQQRGTGGGGEASNDPTAPSLPQPENNSYLAQSIDNMIEKLLEMFGGEELSPTMQRMLDELENIKQMLNNPELTIEQTLVAVMALMGSVRAALKDVTVEELEGQQQEIMNKANDAVEEIMNQIEAQEKADKAGGFMKIFSWIAIAAAAIALVATGGGAAAGFALLLTVMMQVDSQFLDGKMMEGLATGIQEVLGAFGIEISDELAGYLALGAVMLLTIVASGAAMFSAAKGATTAGTQAASTGAKATQTGSQAAQAGVQAAQAGTKAADVAVKSSNLFKTIGFSDDAVNLIARLAGFTQFASTMASGGAQISSSIHQYDADMAGVALQQLEAMLVLIDEMIEIFQDLLATILEAEAEAAGFTSDVLKLVGDSKENTAAHLA